MQTSGSGRLKVFRHAEALCLFAVLLLSLSAFGCVTAPGTNRHLVSADNANVKPHVPLPVVVDEKSRGIESVARATTKADTSVLFFLGGLGGVAAKPLVESQQFIGAVRGKFAAGVAFEETVKSMSDNKTDVAAEEMKLTLVRFEHYPAPWSKETGPGLKGIIEFTGQSTNNNKTITSSYAYAFDWAKGKDTIFPPGEERDTLRELLDYALFHWGQQLLDACPQPETSSCLIESFPEAKSGEFSVGKAHYLYRFFEKVDTKTLNNQDSSNQEK